jgi:hypothetical protein
LQAGASFQRVKASGGAMDRAMRPVSPSGYIDPFPSHRRFSSKWQLRHLSGA